MLQDFIKNFRTYMRNYDLFEIVKSFYEKRQIDIKERAKNKDKLDFEKITMKQLEDAGVSLRELE